MHIFIPVCFDKQSSTIELHVRTQILALLQAGHHCTIMCPPGNFAESIQQSGISVLLTDYEDINATVLLAEKAGEDFSIVHAHPFRSRIVGLEIARRLKIPFALTFHGLYTDMLSSYEHEVDLLIAVNNRIKNYLVTEVHFSAERILLIPNGVDTDVFYPMKKSSALFQEFTAHFNDIPTRPQNTDKIISLVSDVNDDQPIILNILKETWNLQVSTGAVDILWFIVDNGQLQQELTAVATEVNQLSNRQVIIFIDSNNTDTLRTLYNSSDIAIASGQHVLEAMACGTPTISLDEHGYFGLVESENSLTGVTTNFNGKQKESKYNAGTLFNELTGIIYDNKILGNTQKLSHEITFAFFQQTLFNEQLCRTYRFLNASNARNKTIQYKLIIEPRKLLSFHSTDKQGPISPHWHYPEDNNQITLSPRNKESIEISYSGKGADKFYLTTATGGFHVPPAKHADWQIEEGCKYKICLALTTCQSGLSIKVWVIEYDAKHRLSETIQQLHNGQNDIYFTPSTGSTRFRMAIRFSGTGTVILAPIVFFKENVTFIKRQKSTLPNRAPIATVKTDAITKIKTRCKHPISTSENNNSTHYTRDIKTKINTTIIPESPVSVDLNGVSLCYRRTGGFFLTRNKRMRESLEYWAIRDLSLSIYEGDTVGLIGRNGSGKSTISMVISGALKPDTGVITTHGKVQLLALGIGFRPQLTGRENVMVSGSILGLPRKELKAQMDEIEAFAELGDFFDEPIRTYSAGMKSRLGFSISTAVRPDILILDEVMSTGDAAFRNKASKRMEQMRQQTKTVIVVSHSPAQIRALCSRVVWLEKGTMLMDGSTNDILPIYERFCENPDQWLTDHPETAKLLKEPYGQE